jgi:hypothetical protein
MGGRLLLLRWRHTLVTATRRVALLSPARTCRLAECGRIDHAARGVVLLTRGNAHTAVWTQLCCRPGPAVNPAFAGENSAIWAL